MAASILSVPVPVPDRRARLLRRVSIIAQALRFAAEVCPDRDHELKSRLRSAGSACAQLVAHVRRQGGVL